MLSQADVRGRRSAPLAVLFAVCACMLAVIVVYVSRGPSAEVTSPTPAEVDSAPRSSGSTIELVEADSPQRSEIAPSIVTPDFDLTGPAESSWKEGALTVRVVNDSTGAPVVQAIVKASRQLTFRSTSTNAPTDEHGVAEFSELSAAVWQIVLDAPGFVSEQSSALIDRDHPRASIEVRLHEQRTVFVQLVGPDGSDFVPERSGIPREAEATIGLAISEVCGTVERSFEQTTGTYFQSRWVGKPGIYCRWEVDVMKSQTACVHAVLAGVVIAAQVLRPSDGEMYLHVDLEAVRKVLRPIVVRVMLAANDQPIARAKVEVARGTKSPLVLETDSEGLVRVETFILAVPVLTVRAPGLATEIVPLYRPFEEETRVRMTAGCRIRGLVFDQDGNAMPRARLELYEDPRTKPGRRSAAIAYANSGPDGTFEFADQQPARYVVTLSQRSDGMVFPRTFSPTESTPDTVFVDCGEGDVSGVTVRGHRAHNDVDGEPWDPPAPKPWK